MVSRPAFAVAFVLTAVLAYAQAPKPNADPYANNADAGKLSVPARGAGGQGQRRDHESPRRAP